MPRFSSRVTAWALAATVAALVLSGIVTVLLSPARAAGRARPGHLHAVAAAVTRISARSTSKGKILVAPNGHTLYAYSRDRRNRDRCVAVSGCRQIWPLMTAHGRVVAGRGVRRSLLGTIRVRGVRQVTYAGHPLYLYVSDESAADTDYIGVFEAGGRWPAVSPSGRLVR